MTPAPAPARLLLALPLPVVLAGVSALLMLVPAAHAAAVRDLPLARIFFWSGILSLLGAVLVGLATANRSPPRLARASLITMVAAYLLLPLLLELPFWLAVPTASFAQSWFEMVSAFTTTGASLWSDPAILAPTLHLWRATVGWLGGFFIWLVAAAVFQPLNLGGFEVLASTAPGDSARFAHQIGRVADPRERMLRFAARLLPAWVALTSVLWLGLILAGDGSLVALCHAMSTLSTSGISPLAGGIANAPSGREGETLVLLFFVFALSRRTFAGADQGGGLGPTFRDPEFRLGLLIIAIVTVLLFLRHWWGAAVAGSAADAPGALRSAWGMLFSTASFLTTTGFISGDWVNASLWSGLATPGLILLGVAVFGGGVATAAGGLKLLRLHALWQHGVNEIDRLIEPHAVAGVGSAVRRMRSEGAYIAWVFVVLFLLAAATVVLLLTLLGLPLREALIYSISALSTTGQVTQIAGPLPLPWAGLDAAARTLLAIAMVVGRVETLVIIALLNPGFWRR